MKKELLIGYTVSVIATIVVLFTLNVAYGAELYPGVYKLVQNAAGEDILRVTSTSLNTFSSSTQTVSSTLGGLSFYQNIIRPKNHESESASLNLRGSSNYGDGGDVILTGGNGGGGAQPAGRGGEIRLAPGSGTGVNPNGAIILAGPGAYADAIYVTTTLWLAGKTVLTTSTGLGVSNFTSANISQWTNDSVYITTSTNLGILNFSTSSISQWVNNSGYITTSTYNLGSKVCSGSDKFSSISATGTLLCTTDETGAGANGTVTTSSAVSINHFPYWVSNGGLNGTSTLTAQGTGINASGTITQSGTAVMLQGANISLLTNNAGFSSSTGANPTASLGLTAINGTALTFMRSDGAPALSQSIAPTWTGLHIFSNTSTFNAQVTLGSSTANRILITDANKNIISSANSEQACTGNDKISTISATGTVTCTTDQTGAGGSTSTLNITVMSGVIATNMVNANAEYPASGNQRNRTDLTGKTTCRSIVSKSVIGAVAATWVAPQWATSTNGTPPVTWYYLNGNISTGATSTAVATTSIFVASTTVSSWVTVTSTALGDIWLRYVGWNGNATADPNITATLQCY